MKIVAIIPARGGSKRIPRKNIKEFNGVPVIALAIETALQSGLFDEVLVSTNDQEIAEIAKSYGASVPFLRSESNSDDYATTADVLKEVITQLKEQGKEYSYGCCIYPVNPFLNKENLHLGFEKLMSGLYESVFSAVKYDFPVQRSFHVRNGKVSFLYPEFVNSRSQDLEPVYHDAAQFYYFTFVNLVQSEKLITERSGIVEIASTSAQDIDTLSDWELAEIKFQRLKNA